MASQASRTPSVTKSLTAFDLATIVANLAVRLNHLVSESLIIPLAVIR